MSRKVIRLVAIVIALAGLIVLLSSPGLSEAAGHDIMVRHGGGMDTNNYLSLRTAATTGYQAIGAILLAVGLFRALQS